MSALAGEVYAPDPNDPGRYRRIGTADDVTFEYADSDDRVRIPFHSDATSFTFDPARSNLFRRPPRRLADSEYTWGRPR